MKHFLSILVMICASALPVMAGAIPTDGSPEPVPAGTNQTTSDTTPGEIPTMGGPQSLSDAALSAILTALGLASI